MAATRVKPFRCLLQAGATMWVCNIETMGKRSYFIVGELLTGCEPIGLCTNTDSMKENQKGLGALQGYAQFVNIRDAKGATPLHLAARRYRPECLHILLDNGSLVCVSTV